MPRLLTAAGFAAMPLLLAAVVTGSSAPAHQDPPMPPDAVDLCTVIQAAQPGNVFRGVAFDPTRNCRVDYLRQGMIHIRVSRAEALKEFATENFKDPLAGLGDASMQSTSPVDGYRLIFVRRCFRIDVSDQMDTTRARDDPARLAPADPVLVRRIAMAIDQRLAAAPCPDDERPPVIFIPGVAGTVLNSSIGLEMWPLAPVGDRAGMALEADGRTQANRKAIQVGGILDRPGMNFYGGIVSFLKSIGYQQDTDLFVMPYDWRVDNASHYERVDQLVREAITRSGQKKVVLIAHSMGGVIARGYVYSSAARAANVSAFITLGTPYWGAPKVYYGAISGYQFGNPSVRQELMKILIQNYPAAYQLFPRIPFIRDIARESWMSLEESLTVRYKWFTNVTYSLIDHYSVTGTNSQVFNPDLLKQADAFFAPVGTKDKPRPLPGGVKQYAIIGTGVATLGSYELRDFEAGLFDWFFPNQYVEIGARKVVMRPYIEDGDGTVPLWSLETEAATASYYLTAGGSTAHAQLTDNTIAQTIVAALLKNRPPNPAEYGRPQQYGPTRQPIRPGAVLETTSQFELHSDAHLKLVYPNDAVLGFNAGGGIEERAPGTFLSMDGVEFAAVAGAAGGYEAIVTGLQTGRFTLDVNIDRGAAGAVRYSYVEVPVAAGTVARIAMTPTAASAPPTMMVTAGGQTTRVAPTIRSAPSTSPAVTAPQGTSGVPRLPAPSTTGARLGDPGTLTGTWRLTSTCAWAPPGTWSSTIALTEGPGGVLSGTVSNDTINAQLVPDGAQWRSNLKSMRNGSIVMLVFNPKGWDSILQLVGTLKGSRIEGAVHHSGTDDCTFVMVRQP
jgi:pimeloyl-ACP methyl ester carboxylesterase